MNLDPDWVHSTISGGTILALLRLASQYAKNRNAGKLRDLSVNQLAETVERLADRQDIQSQRINDKVDRLSEIVQEDRQATRENSIVVKAVSDRLTKVERAIEAKS